MGVTRQGAGQLLVVAVGLVPGVQDHLDLRSLQEQHCGPVPQMGEYQIAEQTEPPQYLQQDQQAMQPCFIVLAQ
jgi:hypothetical protein